MKQNKIPMSTKTVTLIKNGESDYIFGEEKRYIVPEYQRSYSWGEDELYDFAESVKRAASGEYVFMGTVQFAKRSGAPGEYSIIDGQQRMTTFLLFCRALEEESGADILKSNGMELEIKNFNASNEKLKEALTGAANVKNNRYAENLKYLRKFVNENDIDSESVFQNLYFVALTTTDMPLPDVVGIFNTINTTGLELDCADLFKLQYYEYLRNYKNEDRMADICALYDEMDKKGVGMYWVLDIYKHYIAAKNGLGFDKISMSNERFFDEVFNKISLKDSGVLDFAEFKRIAGLYEKHKGLIAESVNGFSENIIWMTRYGMYWTLPYVSLSLGSDYRSALDASLSAVRYLIINSVIHAKRVNAVCTFMCNEVLPRLGNADEVKRITYGKIADIYEGDKEKFKYILGHGLKDNNKRAVLICTLSALIEEMSAGTTPADIKNRLFDSGKLKYDIEHIKAWENVIDYKDEFSGIGNLVVLESSINRSVKDKKVLDKLKSYEKSCFVSVKNVSEQASAAGRWEIDEVRARANEQIRKISEFLGIE